MTISQITIPRSAYKAHPYVLSYLKCDKCRRLQGKTVKIQARHKEVTGALKKCSYCGSKEVMWIIAVDGRVQTDPKLTPSRKLTAEEKDRLLDLIIAEIDNEQYEIKKRMAVTGKGCELTEAKIKLLESIKAKVERL